MKENILVGKIILDMKIALDRKAILFVVQGVGGTVEEIIAVKADGDCCSNICIELIDLPVNKFPAKVESVEDLNFSFLEEQDTYVLARYGCKIKTDKGDVFIDYRNNSNGYYGGCLGWPGDSFYGGVYNQNISNLEWVEIK